MSSIPQDIIFIVFIIISLLTLFAGHYFLYYSLVHFLKIESANVKIIIAVALFLLAISFIASSVIIRLQENTFSRIFYFSAGLWLGILANFLLAAISAWGIIGLAKIFNLSVDAKIIGLIAIILALLYSVYGVFNAYNPKIKNIAAKIKNLPPEWKNKTAVQISDVHLGYIWKKNHLEKIVTIINSLNPAIVFITGDLIDGMSGNLNSDIEPLNKINAAEGIYFVTGNHETYFGIEKAREILKKTNLKILDDEMANIKGLQIIGISYPAGDKSKNIAEIIKNIGVNPNQPSILLYHSPTQIQSIKESGINLQLAGHTHKGQIFPFNLITKLVYKGYDYGLHREEDYILYASSGVGTWGPTMRTGNKPEIVAITLE